MPTKRAEGETAPQFPGGGGRYDFFVSYTARDRDWAEWIAWHLEAAGWSCVLQAWDFFPGSNFVLRMREAADQAERTLAVASNEYFQSRFASTEWAAALAADPDGHERKLVIARVRQCQPPRLLRPLVRIDLFGQSQEQARSTLIEQIQRVVSGGRAKPRAQPPFPAPALPGAAGTTASFRAAVIGVAAEVGPALVAVADRLGRTPGITTPVAVVDAAADAAPEADLVVALVGGRTGGTHALAAALEQRPAPFAFKLKSIDFGAIPPTEVQEGLATYQRIGAAGAFTVPDEAADLAAVAVAGWLRERAPAGPGQAPVLVIELVAAFEKDGANWPLADRLLALEALGRLGDPRLEGDPWVQIPGGVHLGSAGARFSLNPFHVSWRPITVQDFIPFVVQGWKDEHLWRAGRGHYDGESPYQWGRQLHHPNRPVIGVSWYAARAFCAWATTNWSHPPGTEIDLPTELEWEHAACGSGRESYPWGSAEPGTGDEARANYIFVGGPKAPTPVGAFPRGNRGRLVDLAGNVSEWCRRVPAQDVRTPHLVWSTGVARGGSCADHPNSLNAERAFIVPGHQVPTLGFRVVARPARG